MITKETKGIVADIPIQTYHDSKIHISSSILKKVLDKPREAYDLIFNGKQAEVGNQDALNLGNYVHTLVLEPWRLNTDFAVFQGATRRGKDWEHFERTHKDKTILGKSQESLASSMLDELNLYKVSIGNEVLSGPQLFTKGSAEESCFFEVNGILCKARFDYRVPNKVVRDIKTTKDKISSKEDARAIIEGLSYDLSAAFYLEALRQVEGVDYAFDWVFMSKADYKTTVFRASPDTINKGREKMLKALSKIGYWKLNGYTDEVDTLEYV